MKCSTPRIKCIVVTGIGGQIAGRYQHGRQSLGCIMFIAIAGVLAAVVLPAYQDYTRQFEVRGAIERSVTAKDAVAKAFASKGAADMSSQVNTGWIAPTATWDVPSVSIARDGSITLRFTDKVAPAQDSQIQIVPVLEGKRLDLSDPASAGKKFEWQCGGNAGKSTLRSKFRPEDCR